MQPKSFPECEALEILPSRRTFLGRVCGLVVGASLVSPSRLFSLPDGETARRMKLCFTPGSIGVSANQEQTVALAAQYGFEAVEPFGGYLASLSKEQRADLAARLKEKSLTWGAAGLSVEFRKDDAAFEQSLKELPRQAEALADVGARRVGTWLMPGDRNLTYLQNLRQHSHRLGAAARVLQDHGLRLGLEYVGTFTSRARFKYPFVHTLAETRELIAKIGTGNVGVVLDSWHWWQAEDTAEDILSLKNEDVVSVDLNDAPAGVPKDQQADGRRELPVATGVIDLAAFLKALKQIGYDGPMRAEPFNRPLNDMDNEPACAATINALRRAVALLP